MAKLQYDFCRLKVFIKPFVSLWILQQPLGLWWLFWILGSKPSGTLSVKIRQKSVLFLFCIIKVSFINHKQKILVYFFLNIPKWIGILRAFDLKKHSVDKWCITNVKTISRDIYGRRTCERKTCTPIDILKSTYFTLLSTLANTVA